MYIKLNKFEFISPFLKYHSLLFLQFDKQCGEDNDCHTNLAVDAHLVNMTRQADAEHGGKGGGDAEEMYTARVTERDSIVVRFRVRNLGERAFLAKLFVRYNSGR
jgi:hypothetical protein